MGIFNEESYHNLNISEIKIEVRAEHRLKMCVCMSYDLLIYKNAIKYI